MKKQSKTKLLKVLRTLQGYQRMCFGEDINFDLQAKNYANCISIIVWIMKDTDIHHITIFDFLDEKEVAQNLQRTTAILKEYGIIKD